MAISRGQMKQQVSKPPSKKPTGVVYLKKGGRASPKSKGSKICPAGKAWAQRTFDTYPSAYANMAASVPMSLRVTLFDAAPVTAIVTAIGMKFEGIPIEDSLPVVAPFATVTVAVYTDNVISLVSAPVVELFTMFLKPFSERTGPEKVELAMLISCRG